MVVMLPLVKEAGKFVQTDEIWTTNLHSHLSCILFFCTTATHTKLALVKAMNPLKVSRILVWSLWLQKYPSNELVSFSLIFFSQRLIPIHVTPHARAVFRGFMIVTVPPNVTLWMAQPSLFCMGTALSKTVVWELLELLWSEPCEWFLYENCTFVWELHFLRLFLLFSQGWCFVEDKGNKCVMCVCEKSWFVNQEYYDRWFSLYKYRNVG